MTKLQAVSLLAIALMMASCVTEYSYQWNGPLPDEGTTPDLADIAIPDQASGELLIDAVDEVICTPECDGKQCGDDGCGGDCWILQNCSDGEDCPPVCDDGNPCNGQESCDTKAGVCLAGEAVGADDEIECTIDSCDADTGLPVHEPDHTVCDNGKACDGVETCTPGLGCEAGEGLVVDDEVECTTDACDDETGEVTHTPNDSSCDDGEVCTSDSCDETEDCVFTPVEDGDAPEGECDDENPCTHNLCTAGKCDNSLKPWGELVDEIDQGLCLCTETGECADLEDGNLCNGTLACLAIPDDPTPDDPDDFKACQVDPGTVWSHDGLFCNGLESCDEETGVESTGQPPELDDGFDCTEDACDEDTDSVTHTPNHQLCPQDDVCKQYTCSEDDGCVWVPDNQDSECVDTDVCTMDSTCHDGVCAGIPRIEVPLEQGGCLGEAVCILWSCEPDGQGSYNCTQVSDEDGQCTDNNECTVGDMCQEGQCFPGAAVECGDDFECTTESCNPETGQCEFAYDDLMCNDGFDCTLESCDGQGEDGCKYELYDAVCDDLNSCTEDVCDQVAGCVHTNIETACDDQNPCTLEDSCLEGLCLGQWDTVNCADWDHDGVVGSEDLCPYAFDPQQLDLDDDIDPDACEGLDIVDLYGRPLILSQGGTASQWRRTHEPVEIPLANGIVDNSMVGYWRLNGGQAVDYSGNGRHGQVVGAVSVAGAFGHGAGALELAGAASNITVSGTEELFFQRYSALLFADLSSATPGQVLLSKGGGVLDHNLYVQYTEGGKILVGHENNDVWQEIIADPPVGGGPWSHIAVTFDGAVLALYFDGILSRSLDALPPGEVNSQPVIIGNSSGLQVGFGGRLDEVVLFQRALTATEIIHYVYSGTEYGTRLVPGAQADFDDLRVTESSGIGDPENTGTTMKRSRVLGVRPHSDTPCPSAHSGAPLQQIPGIASREDLCGVAAYWRLDGVVDDVLGQSPGNNQGAFPARGRFGDGGGSIYFDGNSYVTINQPGEVEPDSDLTLEAWVWLDSGENFGAIASNADQGGYGLSVTQEGALIFSVFEGPGSEDFLVVESSEEVPAGRWFHAAATKKEDQLVLYLDGLAVGSGTKESGSYIEYGPAGTPFVLGARPTSVSEPVERLTGYLDEVIVHKTAKSADYVYHRAHPGLPTLRFLANTEVENSGTEEAPMYPLRQYELRWGDANAGVKAPFVSGQMGECYGLLNDCLGYAGWWRFNDQTPGMAVDSSGWKNNGEVVGAVPRKAGANGLAVEFSGTVDSYVRVFDDVSLDLTDSLTIEAVLAPATLTGSNMYFLDKPNSYTGFLDAASAALNFELFAGDNCPDGLGLIGSPVGLGAWSHVTAAYDGTNGHSFLNHGLDDSKDCGGAITPNGIDLYFGLFRFDSGDLGAPFDGMLDSVRISNRALAADEVLHFPLASYAFESSNWNFADSDGDKVLDDGDFSGVKGDNPCKAGQIIGCDDNVPNAKNPDQADEDGDGIGTLIDNCPGEPNPGQEDEDNDGIGDLCDFGHLEDWDHDGLAGGDDLCPFAFNPQTLNLNGNGFADACEPLSGNFNETRQLTLSQDGAASNWRRTHEPVEVPLVNGIIDDSVAGYWKMDGGLGLDSGLGAYHGLADNINAVPGPFGGQSGAGQFNGTGARVLLPAFSDVDGVSTLTFGAWVYPTALDTVESSNNSPVLSRLHIDGQVAHSSFTLALGKFSAHINFDGDFVSLYGDDAPLNQWSHFVAVYDGKQLAIYVNGVLQATSQTTHNGVPLDGQVTLSNDHPFAIGCAYEYGSGAYPCMASTLFEGSIQDVLLLGRVMSPVEIASWYHSGDRYGKHFLSGAQADFDDLRVTETGGGTGDGDIHGDGLGKETVKRTRVIGPRVHSDTPCPVETDDGTWADREDLCGVEAYWRLDGDGLDAGQNALHLNIGAPPDFGAGRFGASSQSVAPQEDLHMFLDASQVPEPGAGALTLEAWVFVPPLEGAYALATHSDSGNHKGYALRIWEDERIDFIAWPKAAAGPFARALDLAPVASNQWHHVAAIVDVASGNTKVSLYIDGFEVANGQASGTSVDEQVPLRLGVDHAGSAFPGKIDEFIIHSVAKSPDYIFHRANPTMPKVRFMANTVVENQGTPELPAYPLREYKVHYGSEAATMESPLFSAPDNSGNCHGLLTPCMGYSGWWRFDELHGATVVDWSAWKNNGTALAACGLTARGRGAALRLDGQSCYATVPSHKSLELGQFTVEARHLYDADAPAGGTVLAKGPDTDPAVTNYKFTRDSTTHFKMFYEDQIGANQEVIALGGIVPGQWQTLVGSASPEGAFVQVDHDQKTVPEMPLAPGFTEETLYFGAVAGPGQFAKGELDSVRIMNRVLTDDETLHFPALAWEIEGDCIPECAGNGCGDDGCGGTCECPAGEVCTEAGVCGTPGPEGMIWLPISAGDFMMGCSPGDDKCNSDEIDDGGGQHLVTVQLFELLETEVTEAQYAVIMDGVSVEGLPAVVEPSADYNGGGGPNSPVEMVDWYHAKAFCLQIGGRLPTEAEWEYAARAGTTTRYYCGDEVDCLTDIAWYEDNSDDGPGVHKHDVKGNLPNDFGLYDTLGNVWEWVEDCHHETYTGAPDTGYPDWSAACVGGQVYRGGAFDYVAHGLRVSYRGADWPDASSHYLGFRCARSVP